MKKYRIKKEAVPFILEKHATAIYTLEQWNSCGIDIKALEEVKSMHISYGIKTSDISSSLAGWDKEGSHFHFTLNFPSVKFHEHDQFSKGRVMRELMNKIQFHIDDFYEKFVDGNILDE